MIRNCCVGEFVLLNVIVGLLFDVRDVCFCVKFVGGEESWDEWMDGFGICVIMFLFDLKR